MTRGSIISRKDADARRKRYRGQRGPNGRPLCCWCGTEIPKGRRRTWCSQACVDDYMVNFDWGWVRRRIFERDKGVCQHCGTDTVKLNRRFRKFRTWFKERWPGADSYRAMIRWCRKRGIPKGRISSDWWDADHIMPVSEGGTNALDNIRTLCIACHRAETAALRKRLAIARKCGDMIEMMESLK